MYKVLAVDDDEGFLNSIRNLLEYKKFEVVTEKNPAKVVSLIGTQNFDCIILDVEMPEITGDKLLKKIQVVNPLIPIVMLSGRSSVSIAVEAIKNGAYDFIEKPLDAERLLLTLKNAIEKKNWSADKKNLLQEIANTYKMIGCSEPFLRLINQIKTLAVSDAKVLILGESGCGKELVARALHFEGIRSGKPYIDLNCAAVPDNLVEDLLFGHVKGSYTDAHSDFNGKFVQADTGTLFLDEIGDMSLNVQAKILRVIQEGDVQPIGSRTTRKVDVRLICATNHDLDTLIKEGKFREDLYHRINVIKIKVPPLRERKKDIPLIARYYINKYAAENNKKIIDIDQQALSLLTEYEWPGNVRELQNVVEKMVVFSDDDRLHSDDVCLALDIDAGLAIEDDAGFTLEKAKNNFEQDYLIKVLESNNYKILNSADQLGIDRTALFKKMKKFGIIKPKT